ncbi:MAG: thioredoxin domain-containing protein [Propionicimonas sp.]|uniref:DsbA family protein n=1 Tax=Propionicimonas sp. TaxID=1955623 RepID=UPI003D0E3061
MPGESQRQRMREAQLANQRAARLRRIIIAGSLVLAAVLIAVMAVVFVQQSQRTTADATASATAGLPYPPNATDARDGIVVSANQGTPVVGLYFDYQCKGCYQFDSSFGAALNILGQTKAITLVYHTRVFLDQGNADGLSHKAALAAACADVVGYYEAYHEAIWEAAADGPYTDQLFLQTIPDKVGIASADLTAFRSCYSNGNLKAFVQGVEDAAMKAGLTETPMLTVNGKAIPNSEFTGMSGDDLKQIIEKAAKG